MDHPFTAILELNEQQLDSITGGRQVVILSANEIRMIDPVIKPGMGSTIANGEEGGGFNYF